VQQSNIHAVRLAHRGQRIADCGVVDFGQQIGQMPQVSLKGSVLEPPPFKHRIPYEFLQIQSLELPVAKPDQFLAQRSNLVMFALERGLADNAVVFRQVITHVRLP